MAKKTLTPKQVEVRDAYIDFVGDNKRHPSRADMRDIGFSRDTIRGTWTSLVKLRKAAKAEKPEAFDGVVDDDIISPKRFKYLKQLIKGKKRVVVTTAVTGAPAHKEALLSLETYCKRNDAELLILVAGTKIEELDPSLADRNLVFYELRLNSNIQVSTVKVPPKNVNPLTQFGRLGQRNGSTILGSPKQFLEFVAVGDNKKPHVIMSTGAITKSRYGTNGEVRRIDYIADHDHVMGAIVIEIEDNKIYHFRQIQFERGGNFVDLGTYYQGKRVSRLAPIAFILGDTHVTETDPTAEQAWHEVADFTGVRRRIHHDIFSGVSINHHEEHNLLNRAMLANQNRLNLEDELRALGRYLDEETAKYDEVVIVDSNHHDFLGKHYLQKGTFMKDPQNVEIGLKLAGAVVRGENALKYAMENVIGLKRPQKIKWLRRDESYRVAGIELGAHGDKGANGSKGSANTLEKAYGNCVVGHSHTPKIMRGFWQVGTSSYLRLPYTEGSSSWFHTSCLVYANGSRQMINSIDGNWRSKEKKPRLNVRAA